MQDSKILENRWNDRACPWRLHHNFTITDEGVALGANGRPFGTVSDAKTRPSLLGTLAKRRMDWSEVNAETQAEKDSDKKRFNWFR